MWQIDLTIALPTDGRPMPKQRLRRVAALALVSLLAQAGPAPTQPDMPRRQRTLPEDQVRAKVNASTIGMAAGLLEGAPIRFATEIARVVDSGDDLQVLPIITRGPSENVEALLYLRGVDTAIINTDVLDQFKKLVPHALGRIDFILNLFPSEVHVFARPEIASIADLSGKKVNFNTAGTAAAYSGPLIFERLGIKVDAQFNPHQLALEQMRSGDVAAAVFVTSKPVDAFSKVSWSGGYKFLPLEFTETFADYYLPSTLSSADYPALVPEGTVVRTIAVPTFLAAYRWPPRSQRAVRVARLVTTLFDRIDKLQRPGFHPKWKDVNLAASVPGLSRAVAAEQWLDRAAGRYGTAQPAARPPAGDRGAQRGSENGS